MKIVEMKAGTRFVMSTDDDGLQEFIRTDRDSDHGWPLVVRLDTGEAAELPKSFKAHVTHSRP